MGSTPEIMEGTPHAEVANILRVSQRMDVFVCVCVAALFSGYLVETVLQGN